MNNAKFRIQELDRRTLSWWKNRRDRIDMNPPYQRKGRRWSTSDKQYLIDSIINGFDIPKFYFTDFTWGPSDLNVNSSAYAVIDGKQRFEAIFDFFDDSITLSDDFSYIADPTLAAAGLTISQLRQKYPVIAEEFENFNPIVMGVVTSEMRYIEELFVRLNRSRPLSGAEVRNAMAGPIPELIRQIASHQFFDANTRFPNGSGQGLNLAAKILMFESHNDFENTKKSNLDKFTAQGQLLPASTYDLLVDRASRVLDEMSEIFLYGDKLLSSEGPIPTYYWLVRNCRGDEKWLVKDFLDTFTDWLNLGNRLEVLDPVINIDLDIYKQALRSVNDKASHEKRYNILKKWFSKWTMGEHR